MTNAIAKQNNNVAEMPKHSLVITLANRYGIEQGKFLETLKGTIFPAGKVPSNEQIAAFLIVANKYDLNPFIREIYAFPTQNGGIQPIVPIDGWATLTNREPNYDGVEFIDIFDEHGKLSAVTTKIYRKDRSHPTEVTEYMSECKRNTSTWTTWPARMLRHKSFIQCARLAFGLAGIVDPDEADRIASSESLSNETQVSGVEGVKGRLKQITEPTSDADAEIIIDGDVEEVPEIESTVSEPVEETEMEDSALIDLRTAVNDLLIKKVGGMASDQKRFLKGRVIDNEDAETLKEMLADLQAM